MKIDIGGGLIPKEGFINLDPIHGLEQFKRHLQEGIPLANDSVDALYSSDTLEHIPSQDRIFCMNECYRVLKPKCHFEIIVPVIGYTDSGGNGHLVNFWAPWADPTHVSYFWFPESFLYFTKKIASADYGIKFWNMIDMRMDDMAKAHIILEKPENLDSFVEILYK